MERVNAIVKWLNITFFTDEPIINLDSISNSSTIYNILYNIDDEIFNKIVIIKDKNTNYFDIVLDDIYNFYLNHIGIEIKKINEDEIEKIIELIIGIAAQCENRQKFLQIMESMDNKDSSQLFLILEERLNKDKIIIDDKNRHLDKIEKLEKRNLFLTKEIEKLNNIIIELEKKNFIQDSLIRENELKLYELLENNKPFTIKRKDSNRILLSIELAEAKGKSEAYERLFSDLRSEKDKMIDFLTEKVQDLEDENKILKQKSMKNDDLLQKLDDYLVQINTLKIKLIQTENKLKEQKEKNKSLIEDENEKSKLLSKIEELNKIITKESNTKIFESADHTKENNSYDYIEYKKTLNELDVSDSNDDYNNQLYQLREENEIMRRELKICEEKYFILLHEFEEYKYEKGDSLINYID